MTLSAWLPCRRRALLAMLAAPAVARAAPWPDRPLRFVIPFPPGGNFDITGRLFCRWLAEELGQTVIAENRPGAATVVATSQVARSAPDGLTLLSGGLNVALNALLMRDLPYDAERDLVAVAQLTSVPYMLSMVPRLPITSVAELIAAAKAAPGRYSYASFGIGGAAHLAGEMLDRMAGISTLHVPFSGAAPAMIEVMAGRVSMAWTSIPPALPEIAAGKLRPIGIGSLERVPFLPEVPTLAETLPGFEVVSLNTIFVPSRTPAEIIARLNQAAQVVMRRPEMQQAMTAQGFLAAPPMNPAETAARFNATAARLATVIREAKLRLD